MWETMSHGQVFLAQAGWDDSDDLFFAGTSEDDGHTLVRCQLFTGRDITKEHTPDRAQGTKMVCHVADGVFKIPVKGARLYVLVPHGMEGVAGAGVIIASVGGGQEVNKNVTAGDMIIAAPGGGQAAVVQKSDGSITLYTTVDNTKDGNGIFLKISKDGFHFESPYGSIKLNATGFHVKTSAGPSIDMGGVNIPGIGDLPGLSTLADAFTAYCKISAPTVKLNAGTVLLGAGSSHNPAMNGPLKPPAPPPPATPDQYAADGLGMKQSQTVYVAP